MASVLADTGALVALLDRSDAWHGWAVGIFKTLRPPVITCEAVLTEAWHLLGESGPSRNALARLHKTGVLRVGLDFEPVSGGVWRLLEKYADTPMDFADACLVAMVENDAQARVWTTDSDFLIYRRHGRQAIPLIAPF